MWKTTSIKFRFNLTIGLLVLVCGFSIIAINTTISRGALESEIRSNTMPSMVQEIAAAVEMHIASPAKTLQALGHHPMFMDWLARGEDPAQLDKIVAFSRQFIRNHGTSGLNIVVKQSTNFYMITLDSVYRKHVDPAIDGWFVEFEEKNIPVFVNIHAPNDQEYANTAFINTRISDKNGQFLGNIATVYSAEELFRHLGGLKVGTRGATFVVRNNGTILLHPDAALNGKGADTLPGFKDHIPMALAGESVTFDAIGASGERLLFVGHPILLLDAMAFTQVNMDEMLLPIDRVRNYSILICLAVLPLGFFLSSLLVNSITRVLRRVIDFSGDVARGEAVHEMEVPKSEEMASLTRALNRMYRDLRQSNVSLEALQGILNGVGALLYVTDLETDRILFINNQMRRHFGLDDDRVGEECWKVLQTGMTGRCPFCPKYNLAINSDAIVRWEEQNSVTGRHYSKADCLIGWTKGEMVHLQHAIDVTERKVAEEDLKRQLEQQALLASMSQSIISSAGVADLASNGLSMLGKFNHASHAFLARHYPQEQKLVVDYQWQNPGQDVPSLNGLVIPFVPGSPLHEVVTRAGNDCISTVGAEVKRLLAKGGAVAGMQSFLAVPVLVNNALWGLLCMDDFQAIRALSPSETHLMRLVGNMMAGAISRSTAEDKLLRMSLLVESAPQYITYIDTMGNFLYVNRGACAVLGYTEEELMAGSAALILGEDALEHVKTQIFPEIVRAGSAYLEMQVRCKGGKEKILALTAFTTPHANHGIGAIAVDVTENRALAREILKAKEQAERSNSAKSEFLSRMSHEMRTPLNAIIGMTAIAQGASKLEKKEYCLERIGNASAHLLGIINDILDMSKIEANKFELSSTEFVFARMLTRICDVVSFKVSEKSQELQASIGAGVPFSVVADEQRLGQVIVNLLSNAIKFTPEKGIIEINASLVSSDGAECVIAIEVRDSGIGISHEDQDRLFKAFEQADGSISRKFGGTGLGLAISRRIVELMGGDISVNSELGKGASFSFTIKAKSGSLSFEKLVPHNAPWRHIPMLLISQSPAIVHQFHEVAQSAICRFDQATDWESALACLEKQATPYGIVWIDHSLPFVDVIARKFKEHYGQGPHIVLVSGNQEVNMHDAAGNTVIDKVLQKPLFSYMIVEYLTEIASQSADEASLHQEPAALSYAGRRVLLAEDVELNREVLLATLEDTGLEFECAENGQEAIDMYKAAPESYDLIFMDIHMPGVDGYEATRQIRQLPLPNAASIPIIAMTANVFKEDVDRCLEAGMNDHLGKPIDKNEILAKLARYL